MDKHIENIAQMAMNVGTYMERGRIDFQALDISSTDMCAKIEEWSHEFHTKYYTGSADPETCVKYGDLGYPFGYPTAIDAFLAKKCEEVGWFSKGHSSIKVVDTPAGRLDSIEVPEIRKVQEREPKSQLILSTFAAGKELSEEILNSVGVPNRSRLAPKSVNEIISSKNSSQRFQALETCRYKISGGDWENGYCFDEGKAIFDLKGNRVMETLDWQRWGIEAPKGMSFAIIDGSLKLVSRDVSSLSEMKSF
jgi:hypothetical protein